MSTGDSIPPAPEPGGQYKAANEGTPKECGEGCNPEIEPIEGTIPKPLGIRSSLSKTFWADIGGILFLWACLIEAHNIYALLTYSLALFIGYIAACDLLFETVKRFRLPVVAGCSIFTAAVIYSKSAGGDAPYISPYRVQLADGKTVLGTKAAIFNPSDADVYDVRFLIVVDNSVSEIPIGSVKSTVEDDNKEPVKMWDGKSALGFDFGFDYISPAMQSRFFSIYRLHPHEHRDLWIQGSLPAKSYANLAVVAYENAPLKIRFSPGGGYFWPVISSNAPAWKYFPGVTPMDIDIEMIAWRGTNGFTNKDQIIPSHP